MTLSTDRGALQRRIPVWQIKTADKDAVDRRFDVAALRIVGLAWKVAAALSRVGSSGEDRDSVPALLAVPNSAVPSLPDCTFRELVLRRLEFLKAHHVRCSLRQPPLENRQAPVHSVDVEGGDPHSGGRRPITEIG